MAFGSTPNHAEQFQLDNLTPRQFLVLALDVAETLDWDVRHISDAGLIALSTKKVFKWKGKVTILIEHDLVTIKSESIGSELVDWGKNKKVVAHFLEQFDEKKLSFSPQDLEERYELLRPQLVPSEEDRLLQPEEKVSFLSFFLPREGYYITPILIDLNILVFVLMAFSGVSLLQPTTASLLKWGANYRPATLEGGWWRLITNFFLHVGILHLLMNMYALLYIGILLEPRLGKLRFTSAYLLAGVTASLASLCWHENTVSAGASGGIFGLYGVFLAMLTTNFIEKTTRKALLVSIGIFVAFNLAYGMKSGIDNAAHLGGLVSGLLIGYLYYPGLKQPQNKGLTWMAILLALAFVTTSVVIAYHSISNDIGIYTKKMNEFSRMERRALSVYDLDNSASREQWLSKIKDTGIYYYNKDLDILREVSHLKLPVKLKQNNAILADYCRIRIESYNCLYRAMARNEGEDQDSIRYFNEMLEGDLKLIKQK